MKEGQVWRELFPGGVEEGIGLNKNIHIRYNISMWHHMVVSRRIFFYTPAFFSLNLSMWERQRSLVSEKPWDSQYGNAPLGKKDRFLMLFIQKSFVLCCSI